MAAAAHPFFLSFLAFSLASISYSCCSIGTTNAPTAKEAIIQYWNLKLSNKHLPSFFLSKLSPVSPPQLLAASNIHCSHAIGDASNSEPYRKPVTANYKAFTKPVSANYNSDSEAFTKPVSANYNSDSEVFTKPVSANYNSDSEAYTKPVSANHEAYRKPVSANYEAYRKPVSANYDSNSEAYRNPVTASYDSEAYRRPVNVNHESGASMRPVTSNYDSNSEKHTTANYESEAYWKPVTTNYDAEVYRKPVSANYGSNSDGFRNPFTANYASQAQGNHATAVNYDSEARGDRTTANYDSEARGDRTTANYDSEARGDRTTTNYDSEARGDRTTANYGSDSDARGNHAPANYHSDAFRVHATANIRMVTGDGAMGKVVAKRPSNLNVFFRENNLTKGTIMPMCNIKATMPQMPLLPRSIATKLPFSSPREVKEHFQVPGNSRMSTEIDDTISNCKRAPSKGETKACITSAEGIIDFISLKLGSNAILKNTESAKGSEGDVMIGEVKSVNGDRLTESVTCHQLVFPYMVYMCHSVPKVKLYEADILDVATKERINRGIAICHFDTSSWSEGHVAFVELGGKPGEIEACHWIFEGEMAAFAE